MPFTLTNPTPHQLLEYVSLRAKEDPAIVLGRVQSSLEAGRSKIEDLWMLRDDSGLWAVFSLIKTGDVRRCILRADVEISDEALTILLRWLEVRAEESGEEVIVHFSSTMSRDPGDLPFQLIWIFESHALMHRTPLQDRADLEPDLAARRFPISEMQTPRFAAFYAPIWAALPECFGDTLEEAIKEYHDRISNLEEACVVYLFGADEMPVGGGLLYKRQEAASFDVVGVTPELRGKGWGNRLHRHLLWAAKELSDVNVGGTDSSNTAMRRLFQKNGCVVDEEQWAFAFRPGSLSSSHTE